MKLLVLGGLMLVGLQSITPQITPVENTEDFIVFNQTVSYGYEYKEAPKPKPIIKPKVRYVAIAKKTPKKRTQSLTASSQKGLARQYYGGGWCTQLVAERVPVYWRGDARLWIQNARAKGIPTGTEPRINSIVQTNESSYGHVAVVLIVEPSRIYVVEMNYIGRGITSNRWIPRNSSKIVGYIYTK